MPYDQQGHARELADTTAAENTPNLTLVYAGVALLLAAWVASVVLWGLPGLYLPAVVATPVMLVTIIRITLG